MRLIDVDVYCATICRCNRRECDKAKCPIHNAPTAYDIDKVVEELKKIETCGDCRNNCEYYDWSVGACEGHCEDYVRGRAIEIVKQGGVADDVCEWKLDGVYLHSPHKPLVSCVADENYRYYYCPYCGKKIKVVE